MRKKILLILCCFAFLQAQEINHKNKKKDVFVTIEYGKTEINYSKNIFFADRGHFAPFERKSNLNTDSGRAKGNSVKLIGQFPLNKLSSKLDHQNILWDFWHTKATNKSQASFFDTGADVRFGWVQLDNLNGLGTLAGRTLSTTTQQNFRNFGTNFLFEIKQYKHNHHKYSFYVGPSFQYLRQKTYIDAVVNDSPLDLNEKLNTYFLGIKAKNRYSHRINKNMNFNFHFDSALYYAQSQYQGHYLFDDIGLTNIKRSLDKRIIPIEFASKVSLDITVTKNLTFNLFANGKYLHNAPAIDYGSVPTDSKNGVLRIVNKHQSSWTTGTALIYRF